MSEQTRPDRPGQAVRSNLDGTLGVTTTRVRPSGLMTVMFIGSDFDGPFSPSDLTVVNLTESEQVAP